MNINPHFARMIKKAWNDYNPCIPLPLNSLVSRVKDAYLKSDCPAYGFGTWITDYATYEELQLEFSEHEIMDIALFKPQENDNDY